MLRLDRMTSLMFLPSDRDDRLLKAAASGAGAIILDLEDGVSPAGKAAARAKLPAALRFLREHGQPSIVRLNAGAASADDLAAMAGSWPDAVMIPKVQSAGDLCAVREAMVALGAEPCPRLVALIETPAGVLVAADIARACTSTDAVAFGGEDYATAMGLAPTGETLSFAAHQVALAGRAHGLAAFGLIGSIAEIRDQAGFLASCRAARNAGFTAALTVHPDQVKLAAQAFSPTEAEVLWARAIVQDAEAAGGAAIAGRDGRLIDRPIVQRAIWILDRQ